MFICNHSCALAGTQHGAVYTALEVYHVNHQKFIFGVTHKQYPPPALYKLRQSPESIRSLRPLKGSMEQAQYPHRAHTASDTLPQTTKPCPLYSCCWYSYSLQSRTTCKECNLSFVDSDRIGGIKKGQRNLEVGGCSALGCSGAGWGYYYV